MTTVPLPSPPATAARPLAARLAGRFPLRLNATVVRETAWLGGGFAAKLVIQVGTLYYLTHNLGVAGSGTFFAIVSLLTCVVPFVQMGNYDLTVRDIARRVDPQVVAGRALRSSAAAFCLVLPVVACLRPWVAPAVGWVPFLMIATGELLVMRVTTNVQAVATGFRLHYVAAVSDFALGASRLAAVYAAARVGLGVNGELALYGLASLPAAAAAYAWLCRRIGRPALGGGRVFHEMADHARMVVAWFGEMAALAGDKPLLAAVAGPAATGIYGTAAKLYVVVLVPIDVLQQVLRPRLNRAYADGDAHGRRLYHVAAGGLFACGLALGGCLMAAALLAPRVAPQLVTGAFGDTRVALIYLAFLPPIYGLQRANILAAISRGATGAYATATSVSAVAGLATLAALGHRYGWRAACVAAQVYLCMSCLTLWLLTRAEERRARAPAADEVDTALPGLQAAAGA